jgi:DNA-binding response OmpR family regulator
MTKSRALIIEDDPSLGAIFQIALLRAGFDVEFDSTGKMFMEPYPLPRPTLLFSISICLMHPAGIYWSRFARVNDGRMSW